jgi:glycosyltransferase involved in cell wall biosynthesis
MGTAPPLTVAVPTYRGARHLKEALLSILGQTGPPFDLLICDDHSDDDTLAIAREVAGDRARIEPGARRLGLAGNWNRCVALSRTPWVVLFHQDDVMRPGHLEAHLQAGSADDRVGMVCGAAEVIDDGGRPVPPEVVARDHLGPVDRVFAERAFLAELAVSNPVRCSAVTLRRAALDDVGGFDPAYRYVVDWECWIRLARRWRVAWLGRPTVAVRWHSASETHRFKSGTEDLDEQVRLLAALHDRERADWNQAAGMRRAADHRLARAFLHRAYEGARSGDSRLVRLCLRKAFHHWPGMAASLVRDPRLTARLILGRRLDPPSDALAAGGHDRE